MSWLGQRAERRAGTHRLAASALALLLAAPFVGALPGLHDEGAVLRDLRAAPSTCCSATPACCRSATRPSSARAAYATGWLVRNGGLDARARRARRHAGRGGCSASSSALIAIRRQGIYFAMITLALAQMLYFVFLQAPFTGGEDGLQGVPRGKLFGLLSLDNDLAHVLLRAGGLRRRCSCSSCASCTRRTARC